jgi:putative IMPACT (imprinted ancient) family translation regulator
MHSFWSIILSCFYYIPTKGSIKFQLVKEENYKNGIQYSQTMTTKKTPSPIAMNPPLPPPPTTTTTTIQIADSIFLGFIKRINNQTEAVEFQSLLQKEYTTAAHIPFCWIIIPSRTRSRTLERNQETQLQQEEKEQCGYTDDGEPSQASCGKAMLQLAQLYLKEHNSSTTTTTTNNTTVTTEKGGIVLAIVRFFQHQLLGVTCGRLTQCYQSISKLTLHRFYFGPTCPLQEDSTLSSSISLSSSSLSPSLSSSSSSSNAPFTTSKYGLGAGDCELVLNILSHHVNNNKNIIQNNSNNKDDDHYNMSINSKEELLSTIIHELNFDGFKGNQGEELPRLQNLQADISQGIIPVYRYPGNYQGDEWDTFEWSQTSLQIKNAVEEHLKPLYDQTMNHCVTNYYRNGHDFIDHHSDKDLDLNKNAVIVSVSIGEERILELKRRAMPRDTMRIVLPHGSMLVLGPYTNKLFTHSILKKEDSSLPRVSLTFRHVQTFCDLKTNRLFGEGVISSTLNEVRRRHWIENSACVFGLTGILFVLNRREKSAMTLHKQFVQSCFSSICLCAAGFFSFRNLSRKLRAYIEEQNARQFFSQTSINGTKY